MGKQHPYSDEIARSRGIDPKTGNRITAVPLTKEIRAACKDL